MAINQQSDFTHAPVPLYGMVRGSTNKKINFDPPPLKITKKGKKIFQLLIVILWVSTVTVTVWQLSRSQSQSSSSSKGSQDILPIVQSDSQDTGNSDIRLDEILGSKRFDNTTGSDMETANPTENAGSVEKLLEGKEIVVPKK